MLSARKQDGSSSRTIRTAQLIAMLGVVQTGLAAYGIKDALPEEWQWVYGPILIAIGVWIAWLRESPATSVPLQSKPE